MPISLKASSGGSNKVPVSFSGTQTIPAASSGVLLTITPPLGRKVVLTSLRGSTGNAEHSLRLTLGGNIVAEGTLVTSSGVGSDFGCGIGPSGTTHPVDIALNYNDTLVLEKTTGPTVNSITYSYYISE